MKQQADLHTHIVEILRGFEKNPVRAGRELRDALHADSQGLLAALLTEAGSEGNARGIRYAMILLLHNDVLIPSIANPALTSLQEALGVTRYMLKLDSNFINAMLTALLMRPDLIKSATCTIRVLDIVSQFVGHLGNWRSITRIHQAGDGPIRKKCAELIAQYRFEDPDGLERFCRADPRVRANIVEILWSVDRSRAQNLLEAATQDESNRVAGNAWLALYAEGQAKSLGRIADMLESTDRARQVTAAWVMGQTRDGRFASRLLEATRSDMPELRKTAFSGLSRLEPMPKPEPDAFTPRPDESGVTLVSAPESEEGFELWLRVTDSAGEPQRNIKPLDFFVFAEDEPLLDYSVELIGHVHNAAVGIVYPAACAALARAIGESIATKATGHRWALNAYGPSAGTPGEFPAFESNPNVLKAILDGGRAVSESAAAAVRNLVLLDPKLPERHLVVILDGDEPDPDIETIRSLCREKRFALHCWRFRENFDEEECAEVVPGGATSGPRGAETEEDGGEMDELAVPVPAEPVKPRGARKFWEIDEDLPPAPAVAKAPARSLPVSEPQEKKSGPESSGDRREVSATKVKKRKPAVPGIVRDEENSVSMWPCFVASMSSRYVLRSQRRPTAVSIRLAGSGARFSAFTRLLKGVENG
jgi:hypothetical protein